MSSYLRRISSRRLAVLIACLAAALGAGTAIAIAATGGATPPPSPLAQAVQVALSGGHVDGVSARVTFTNTLIDSTGIASGTDPVLAGGSGRLWISAAGDVRLELQSDGGGGDVQAVLKGDSWWIYHAAAGTVYRGTLPAEARERDTSEDHTPPTLAQVARAISRLGEHLDLSGAQPDNVAGRPAYSVRLSPQRDGGLVGGAELAFDAANGAPLRLGVYASGDRSPVLELTATDVSFGAVPASAFNVQAPAAAKVVDVSAPQGSDHDSGAAGSDDGSGASHADPVSGLDAVQAKVGFTVTAPATLAGMDRNAVRLAGSGADAGALVTYGRGLGGIAVLETPVKAGEEPQAPAGGEGPSLPTVSIGSAEATKLATALGTALTFTRDGVRYVVLGSVTAATAETAARGL